MQKMIEDLKAEAAEERKRGVTVTKKFKDQLTKQLKEETEKFFTFGWTHLSAIFQPQNNGLMNQGEIGKIIGKMKILNLSILSGKTILCFIVLCFQLF